MVMMRYGGLETNIRGLRLSGVGSMLGELVAAVPERAS